MKSRGYGVTRLGARHKAEGMVRARDPHGREVFWLGPPGIELDVGEDTDFYAVSQGYVSITPLTVDLTAYRQLSQLQHWIEKL